MAKKVKSEIYHDLHKAYGTTTTPDAIAKPILHVHPSTCRRLCTAGVIPAVKVGKQWVIPTTKLAEYLESSEAYVK